MQHRYRIFLFSLFTLIATNTFAQTSKPEPAFPFLSALPNIRDFSMSALQDEVYFTVQSPNEDKGVIVWMKKKDDLWMPPELLPFCGQYRDIEPFLSSDGLRLYFSSDRPVNAASQQAKNYDIWFVWRSTLADQWSDPINLGAPVNTAKNEFYPAMTNSGNLYFTREASDGKGKDDIWISRYSGKGYTPPQVLDTAINSAGYEFNAYVSPDEQFMIFTKYGASDGLGSGDLYISKHTDKGWTKAINMGATVNSPFMDYCPFYDAPGKTLFFTSRRNSIADIPYPDLKSFTDAIGQYENGQSRLYKIVLNDLFR